MSVVAEITAPNGEVEWFRFPSMRVALNAKEALRDHGFEFDGLQRWLAKYGRFVINGR